MHSHTLPEHILNYHYKGALGAIYTPTQTTFRVWAPFATHVELVLFNHYYGTITAILPMERSSDEQLYTFVKEGDCHQLTYLYRIHAQDGTHKDTVDPYAKAVTVNGHRGVVVDLSQTNPDHWGERMPRFVHTENALIYEMHIRDFSIAPSSGIQHKGQYLGVIERGTKNTHGQTTGLDYLLELGITHVELLPFFDYVTVDETQQNPEMYNWGYDPLNYNVPEGSYATDPYDPLCRIREAKQMIQGLHDAGIRVIMDVVYNHVYQCECHPFHYTAPGYYFRHRLDGTLSNGTGVGNDTASEQRMMRKFIVDSVVYWAKEYHIDGFRFDLMGIHDIDTMKAIRAALDEIDPSIIVLGEGWDLMTELDGDYKASSHNAPHLPGISFFNDGLREALKGNDFEATAKGFINGAWYEEQKVYTNALACEAYHHYLSPQQLIQYVESHDNFTLFDKLVAASPHESLDIIKRRHELATSIILLSQGIPFLHAGQEFLRSKNGIRDSYNQPDRINQLDWDRRSTFNDSVEYIRQLIQLRKQQPILRLNNYEAIRQQARFIRADYQIVAYALGNYSFIFNAQKNVVNYPLSNGEYQVIVLNRNVHLSHHPIIIAPEIIAIEPYTVAVIKRMESSQ